MTKTQICAKSKLNLAGPCCATPWKGGFCQDDYLCEVALWSHWVHLGLAQALRERPKLRHVQGGAPPVIS